MQLCKYLNCFLKAHNKQLTNIVFILFFLTKKKVLKNSSGQVDSQKTWVESRVNPFLLRVKKIRFRSGIFWVELGQKILTRFAMST